VASGAVPAVEPGGVGGVEVLHASDEGGSVGFNEKMVVVAHEDVAVDGPAGAEGCFTECLEKDLPVLVVAVDGPALVATAHDMIDGSGKFDAGGSRHGRSFSGGFALSQ